MQSISADYAEMNLLIHVSNAKRLPWLTSFAVLIMKVPFTQKQEVMICQEQFSIFVLTVV